MEIASTITGPRRRKGWRVAGSAVLVTAVIGVSAAPARADDGGQHRVTVTQTNLVANRDGLGAALVDPDLQNPWGMSKFPGAPVWVSNNHTSSSTLYLGGSAAAPTSVTKVPLTVSMAGTPTGQVANGAAGFNLTNGSSARFIFATEQGQLFGWNGPAGTTAEQRALVAGANYKGLAEGSVDTSTFLYAADFANGGHIDVFDSAWNMVNWPGAFHVRRLPAGFAPFNVQVLRDANGAERLFVAYAKVDPATGDEVKGQGLGLVVEFTTDGEFVRRFSRGSMNAPWGLAYAPASWGRAAGDLLVGQFGNGQIEMFNPETGRHTGTVRDGQHHKLAIDGLWALMAGDASSGGDGTVLFTAGPNEEADGLYGVLTFVAPSHHD